MDYLDKNPAILEEWNKAWEAKNLQELSTIFTQAYKAIGYYLVIEPDYYSTVHLSKDKIYGKDQETFEEIINKAVNDFSDKFRFEHEIGKIINDAAEKGDLNIIKYLVDKYKLDVKSVYYKHINPLIIAVQNNQFDVVKYLVENGADVNDPVDELWTVPLFFSKSPEMSIYLIEHGAKFIVGDVTLF